jgi:hypothetical protein
VLRSTCYAEGPATTGTQTPWTRPWCHRGTPHPLIRLQESPKSNYSRTSKKFARKSNHSRTYAKTGGWGSLPHEALSPNSFVFHRRSNYVVIYMNNYIVGAPTFWISARPLFSANLCVLCASTLSLSFSVPFPATRLPKAVSTKGRTPLNRIIPGVRRNSGNVGAPTFLERRARYIVPLHKKNTTRAKTTLGGGRGL